MCVDYFVIGKNGCGMRGWHRGYCSRLQPDFSRVRFPAHALIKMKIHTKHITVNTKNRIDFVNITEQVRKVVEESGIRDGIVLVNPMHITASVFINDNESGLLQDFRKLLEELAPMNLDDLEKYKHNLTGEDNAYAHLWRTIMGRESVIAISNGDLDFGTWEAIFYGEFDGQRNKRILIKVLGE